MAGEFILHTPLYKANPRFNGKELIIKDNKLKDQKADSILPSSINKGAKPVANSRLKHVYLHKPYAVGVTSNLK
jgi:hypothetical protein